MKTRRLKNLIMSAASITGIFCGTALLGVTNAHAQDLTNNSTGTHNGFYYSFWKDTGNVTFGLREGGRYTSQWSNINNWVGGKGWNPGGRKVVNYSGSYNVDNSQNSYLALYGWTKSPLIEYYVIESYGSYNPSSCTTGRQTFGTFQSDGATYSIVRCQRVQQPSIEGTQTFYQYFSVREPKKGFGNISGTITTGNHFDAWQRAGLNLGTHDYMVMATEGYQSTGSSDITVSEGFAGGNNNNGENNNNGGNNSGNNNAGGNNNSGGNNGSNNGGNNSSAGNSTPSSTGITVRARGAAGGEHINLRIGSTVVQEWTLTNSFQNYTYQGSAVGDIQVEFDNDGGDRDVILDYVFANGETRQAEDMEYNTATYDGECGGGSFSETMHCNGVIGFGGTGDCFSGNCNSSNTPSDNAGNNNNFGNNSGNNNNNPPVNNSGGTNPPIDNNNAGNNPPTNNNGGNNAPVNNGGGQCECNWYGSRYALCQGLNGGWGWENNSSCIGRDTCGDQYGDGGVVCN